MAKISREVEGSNLHEVGTLYTLNNPKLRKDMMRLALQVAAIQSNHRIIIGLMGRKWTTDI